MSFTQIINRFIYRDLIYIFSGSIILFYLGYIYNYEKCYFQYFEIINNFLKENSTNFVLLFFIGGLAYVLALFSQIIFRCKCLFSSKVVENQKIYQDKIRIFLKLNNDNSNISENFERIVIFKQIGTTLGSSLLIASFLYAIRFILIIHFKLISCNIIFEIIGTAIFFAISIYACWFLNKDNIKNEKDILGVKKKNDLKKIQEKIKR